MSIKEIIIPNEYTIYSNKLITDEIVVPVINADIIDTDDLYAKKIHLISGDNDLSVYAQNNTNKAVVNYGSNTNNCTLTLPNTTGTIIVDADLVKYYRQSTTNSISGSVSGQAIMIAGNFTCVVLPVWIGTKGIASIGRNGMGNFTITYATAFTYIPSVVCSIRDTTAGFCGNIMVSASSTSACTIRTYGTTGSPFEFQCININIVGI